MRKVLVSLVLSLSLLSVGHILVNPADSKEELNENLIREIENENIESIKVLISKGQNVNSVIEKGNYKGFTPLMFASKNGTKEIVDLLISKGANVNSVIEEGYYKGFTPLMFASRNGNKQIVELLISNGANVNSVIEEGNYKGFTPLNFSCKDLNKEIVELLILKGANVNSVIEEGNYKGFTPLMFASKNVNIEIVELLIKNGANPNIFIKEGNYKGLTPLIFAIETDNKELESLLIKNSNSDSISYAEDIKNRSKYSSIRANMHTVQTMVETYGVDFNSNYTEKLEELIKEAKSKSYWKDIKNPFTEKSGLGKNGVLMDYKTYKNYKPNKSLRGLVLYESIDPKFDKKYKKLHCFKYNLYGTDENGQLLKDENGKVFFLTNI